MAPGTLFITSGYAGLSGRGAGAGNVLLASPAVVSDLFSVDRFGRAQEADVQTGAGLKNQKRPHRVALERNTFRSLPDLG